MFPTNGLTIRLRSLLWMKYAYTCTYALNLHMYQCNHAPEDSFTTKIMYKYYRNLTRQAEVLDVGY